MDIAIWGQSEPVLLKSILLERILLSITMELALNKQDGIAWGGSYIPMSDSVTLRALRRDVHSWGDHYLVTQQQMQSLVSAKVEQYQKIAKTFQRYIGELEEELDKVYEELDEKDEALTAETQRRETVELELENLHAQRAEMEQQLANAQQVTRDASSLLTHLDNEADQLTAKVISGEISEEQSNAMEEELIRAQAKKLAATTMEERWGQQLTEVNRATEEATARAREAEERQRLLSEELAVLQESLRKAEEERDREQQSRESAEGKFNELVRRLQERVGSRQM
ncbi:unnamed protein product [Durusdinium trenchii]|uniref:Uncharacterized protein n=1 Tax=Durusdinium trenchii TaxID=1381693 RepID=A0ABP0Q864_9DINO